MELSEHQGVIALGDQSIQVTIGISDIEVLLISDEAEVGKWSHNECHIVEGDPGTYLIEAENDRLPFIPRDPAGFARVLGSTVPRPGPALSAPARVAPPPGPLTLAGFYLLVAATTFLGLWAIWTMIT